MKELKEKALVYNEWGFNITQIRGNDKLDNGFQDSFKIPINDWQGLRNIEQNKEYVMNLSWENTSGIGAITGFNDLKCIDIDGCDDDELVNSFVNELGLGENYQWIVKSGSGNGYHIWFKCKEYPSVIPYPPNDTLYFFPKKNYLHLFKQIELKLYDHVLLPPSVNKRGNEYVFQNGFPTAAPESLEMLPIIELIEQVADCKNGYKYEVAEERENLSICFLYISDEGFTLTKSNQYNMKLMDAPLIIREKDPSNIFHKLNNILSGCSLLVTYDNKGVLRQIFRDLDRDSFINYKKPVFEFFEMVKLHFNPKHQNLSDLENSFFPFRYKEKHSEIDYLEVFKKCFFKTASYSRNIRFKFKQALNFDIQNLNLIAGSDVSLVDKQFRDAALSEAIVFFKYPNKDQKSKLGNVSIMCIFYNFRDDYAIGIRLDTFKKEIFYRNLMLDIIFNPQILYK